MTPNMNRSHSFAFTLGIKAAEMVHGVTRKGREIELTDAAVWDIAEGSFTLFNSPEELAAEAPQLPPELTAAMPGFQEQIRERLAASARNSRHDDLMLERQVAQMIVSEWKLQGIPRPN